MDQTRCGLPPQYREHVEAKNQAVNAAFAQSPDCYGFVFLTDLHLSHNRMFSADIIRSIFHNTPVRDVICGGDVISGYGTAERIAEDLRAFRQVYAPFRPYFVRGDHEINISASEKAADGILLDTADVLNGFFRSVPSDAVIGAGKTYYYFDRPQFKLRLIALDTSDRMAGVLKDGCWQVSTSVSEEQVGWFLSLLKETPEGYRIVLLNHLPLSSALRWHEEPPLIFGEIAEAFNRRSVLDVSVAGVSARADFRSATGKILLSLGGHGHTDDFCLSPSGCVYYEVNDDSCIRNGGSPFERLPGTPSESALDVILLSPSSPSIRCFRYGAGEDKVFENA